jgi:hypothetical protein
MKQRPIDKVAAGVEIADDIGERCPLRESATASSGPSSTDRRERRSASSVSCLVSPILINFDEARAAEFPYSALSPKIVGP